MRIALSLTFMLVLSLTACAEVKLPHPAPAPDKLLPDKLVLEQTNFLALPGWEMSSSHDGALKAFTRFCEKLARLPDSFALSSETAVQVGTAKEWRDLCKAAMDAPAKQAREFFQASFIPFRVTNNGKPEGLFTGYYELTLEGSRTRTDKFRYPIYALPEDIKRYKDQPYFTREDITNGSLRGRGLEIVFVSDPVELFFLHVQGSGRVQLPDGSEQRVGYAGSNGHPYASIGAYLIAQGEVDKATLTAPILKDWLHAHPDEMERVMNQNPSYIFFQAMKGEDGPIGAQGVPLTPEHSLAVDTAYIPHSVPLWLDTTLPVALESGGIKPYQQLFIAQDKGSAIKGMVRGDVFFGSGKRAELLAGHMKQPGEYYILLPIKAAQRVIAQIAATSLPAQ